jgi:hypothetical protein
MLVPELGIVVVLAHSARADECPLLKEKQTRFAHPELFSFDP